MLGAGTESTSSLACTMHPLCCQSIAAAVLVVCAPLVRICQGAPVHRAAAVITTVSGVSFSIPWQACPLA